MAAATAKNTTANTGRQSLTPEVPKANNTSRGCSPIPKSQSQQSSVVGVKEKKPSSEFGSAIDRFASIAFPMVGNSSYIILLLI